MIYLELFFTFLQIGAFTFGGGYAMLPLVQNAVLSHGWMTQEELIDFIAVSESTPGPFAVNVSTYVGNVTAGFFGACCATLGVVLPSFVIILLVAKCFSKFQENTYVQSAMTGLKPAVIGLIAAAVLSTGQTVFFADGVSVSVLESPTFLFSLILFVVMVFLAMKNIHPITLIVLSAIAGIAFGCVSQVFR